MSIKKVVSVGAVLLVAGLAACGGTEPPAAGEPTPAVETTEPTPEPTPEPVDYSVPGTVVPSREEAEAAGVTTYRSSSGQRITVDPAQELPQNVQDDFASLRDRMAQMGVTSQFNEIGVHGMYVLEFEDSVWGVRYDVTWNTGETWTPEAPAEWTDFASERGGAGFVTKDEALEFVRELRSRYDRLGALRLYDLTD